jgi:hypothetical protein
MKKQLKPSIDRLETRDLLAVMPSPHVPIGGLPPGSGTTPLRVSLVTNQTSYTSGQVVQITFRESTNTGQAVAVEIGPSIDNFHITHGGSTAWRSNPGIAAQFIEIRELELGQSIVLTAAWTAPSVAGAYQIHNQLDPQVVATFYIDAH